jgi:hypothetical protein
MNADFLRESSQLYLKIPGKINWPDHSKIRHIKYKRMKARFGIILFNRFSPAVKSAIQFAFLPLNYVLQAN